MQPWIPAGFKQGGVVFKTWDPPDSSCPVPVTGCLIDEGKSEPWQTHD